jgi:hypothetical protein
MGTMTTTLPTAGAANATTTQDNLPGAEQIAETAGTNAPAQPAAIPGVPNGEVHVALPVDQTVVRVQVAPGETIDLPFDGAMAAKIGDQGNLAIKVGDQTVILLGYGEANQQQGVTLHDDKGHVIDVAAVVAQTDPNLDIQTAAGPAAGPAGGQGGHLFFGFTPGDGLGGLGELGTIAPTQLQYKLIQPDEQILLAAQQTTTADHSLTITSTDGGASVEITKLSLTNNPVGSADVGDYLLNTNKEGKAISQGLVNGVDPANLHLSVGTDVTVTFQREGAAYHNMVGVYTYDAQGNISNVQFIWLDASQTVQNVVGNTLVTDFLGNTQPMTVDIGTLPAGTNLGFFVVKNGVGSGFDTNLISTAVGTHTDYATDLAALNKVTSIVIDQNGVGHVVVNGTQLKSEVIFTDPTLNKGQADQAISGVTTPSQGNLYVGFEDKYTGQGGTSDKDYNDVVFSVNLGAENISHIDRQVFSPHIQLGDSVNDITQMTMVTTGFLAGDTLNNLTDANGFHVVSTQNGDNYQIVITETTTHTTTEWQNFVNNISFTSTSNSEGTRDIVYTVSDSAGHAASTTAHVDVTTQHIESLSTETAANHPGTNLLHDGANAGHDVLWGKGDDTIYLDQNFANNDGKLDMGAGANTVQIGGNHLNITSSDAAHLANVDHIDTTGYNGGGNNTVTLKASDIISMTDSSHTLRFDGDTGDAVKLTGDGGGAGHWTAAADTNIGGVNYHQYEWHSDASNTVSAVVQINEHLTQSVTD